MKSKSGLFMSFLCGLAFINNIQAQGLYLGLGGGYGFAAAKQTLSDDYKSTTTFSGTTYEYTAHPVSFGKGINAGLYVGYMINKNIGIELGGAFLLGSKSTFTNEVTNTTIVSNSIQEDTWKARSIRLIPTIRMTSGENKLHPYLTTGLIVALGSKLIEETHTENTNFFGTSISDESWEFKGGISLGFHGSIGINYMLNDKIGIFIEGSGNYQSWAPKKGILVKNTVDGIDQLPGMTISDKEIDFVNNYTEGATISDPNKPSESLKFFMPMSSIGVNIGIHIQLGGEK